jgi:hypothetical protein
VRSPDEVTPVEHPVADTTEADAAEVLLAPDETPQPDATPPWNYGAPGDVCIPHAHLDDSDGKVRAGTTNNTNNTNRCGGRDVARNVSTTKTAFTIRVLDAQVLRLLPFVRWERADATTTTYRVTTDRIARAIRQGYSDTQLWTMENGECSMQNAECRTDA